MSEKVETIKVKYTGEGTKEITVGNFGGSFESGEVVEVDPNFSIHLLSRGDFAGGDEIDYGFPDDFPGRHVFEEAGLTFEIVTAMSLEQLIALDGIGEKTAEKVIEGAKVLSEETD